MKFRNNWHHSIGSELENINTELWKSGSACLEVSGFQLFRVDGIVRVWKRQHAPMDLACQQAAAQFRG